MLVRREPGRKLTLSKETLRELTPSELSFVAGGWGHHHHHHHDSHSHDSHSHDSHSRDSDD
jgi:hypothetical protein